MSLKYLNKTMEDIMMENKSLKRDSLSKQVSDKLEDMIECGDYKIGERIPTEQELMNMFEVSRNTVREAVRSLTWAGVLEVKQGDGTYVRSKSRFTANMQQKYSETSLDDISEARNCLEVTIAHLAANRRTDEDLELIQKALINRNSQLSDIKENTRADMNFHMAIAEASHNVIILDLYRSISDYLEEHIAERQIESTLSFEEIDDLHEHLYKSILNKNSKEAIDSVEKILNI